MIILNVVFFFGDLSRHVLTKQRWILFCSFPNLTFTLNMSPEGVDVFIESTKSDGFRSTVDDAPRGDRVNTHN